ncbi:DUF4255 domain-containing protein [Dyella ginsengisoli]|uniref:DUF4255 domain-containing protein n=1 Tax=Dyella ginsengisoli TaxID=363848 RepID=UPI0003454972|nr:DUF4255 domain-containing protein [Dyella ginsengisoli]
MSSPLAIGAVSAVLRNLLDNGMIEAGSAVGTTVNVSAVAPDTIDLEDAEAPPRLNLFLHQVTPNAAWRNAAMPSRNAAGERQSNAPLAVDLHYVLTAYGRTDFHAEILLGYAMHLLHERPWLDRASIRRALDPSPLDVSMLPPAFQALAASDLADQVESIKITQAALGIDEMSKLWSAIQSHYRPSAAYMVSVLLIEGTHPARLPLPVLSRGTVDPATQRDAGVQVHPDLLPATPTLFAATPPHSQKTARLGETVEVTGIRLNGTGATARLMHRLLEDPLEIAIAPNATGTGFSLSLPNDGPAQAALPAGAWQLSVRLTPDSELHPRETNAIPLLLSAAPVIAATGAPLNLPAASVIRSSSPARVRVTLASRPLVHREQIALLTLGTAQSTANPRAATADPLVFDFPDALAAGTYPVRLRVDGVDSELVLIVPGQAPVFDPAQQLGVPA